MRLGGLVDRPAAWRDVEFDTGGLHRGNSRGVSWRDSMFHEHNKPVRP